MEHMTRDDVMRETVKHVRRVGILLADCQHELSRRAVMHDDSKFSEQEFPYFAEATPALRGLTYGSDEYREQLKKIQPAIDHHNMVNRHHPEHFACDNTGYDPEYDARIKDGRAFNEMNLLDLIEMLADWKAATERHDDGDLSRSISINQSRFGYSDHMVNLLRNTASFLGWI